MKTPRRRAREFAVQGIYQATLNPEYSADDIVRNIRESEAFVRTMNHTKPQVDEILFAELIHGVLGNQASYLDLLRPVLDRKEEEVSAVERAVLLMATHELQAMPQTPYPVIINEAVETAKTFGGTDGYKFINGILDKLAETVRVHEPIRKTRHE